MTAYIDTAEATEADAHRVTYHFACQGAADDYVVTGFAGIEALNAPYHLTIHLETTHEVGDANELLGREATFTLERDEQTRTFRGIIARVITHDQERNGQSSTVEVVPALHALKLVENTRIFQEKSALEIVEMVLAEGLGAYGRAIDSRSVDRQRYLTRDYCVQYRETTFDFVHRLLEEEGIGYYFRHDEDAPETFVLFDDNADLTRVRTMNQGPVRFDPASRAWMGSEPVLRFRGSNELTPSRITVRDHDWTSARSTVEASLSGAEGPGSDGRHSHAIYEHGFDRQLTIHEDNSLVATLLDLAVQAAMPFGPPAGLANIVHDLPGAALGGFTSSNAVQQAARRLQGAQRDARRFHGIGLVTGFAPGCRFDMIGHPTLGADGAYLLTKVVHTSSPTEPAHDEGTDARVSHNYENAFECLPVGTPWRPDRRTRKPRIYGVQTGRVTGPMGMEVHTDTHGRIKVRFPWDRSGEDLSGNYTCWLRIGQTWAGNGSPGFLFIPRVGMEVIISFVDGDPDRPLVTGCVYNGENATPNLLPFQATKSIIRTRTIPHGLGHNEISFEDARGMERVHIRAQRDLDELVLQDHLTNVGRSQANRVTVDQVEEVGRDQQLHVHGDRTLTISGVHAEHCSSDRLTTVNGSERVSVGDDYMVEVEGGTYQVEVGEGECVLRSRGPIVLEQDDTRFIELSSDSDEPGITLQSDESTVRVRAGEIELTVGGSTVRITPTMIRINGKVFPAQEGI